MSDKRFCIKKFGEPSSFEDDTWQCERFWDALHNQGLEDDFDSYMLDSYPDGLDLTSFNDMLRFDGDNIIEALGGIVEESKKSSPKKKVIKESKSVQRELFEYAENWIDSANVHDEPGYESDDLIAIASGKAEPDYKEIAEGILSDYESYASPEAIDILEAVADGDGPQSAFDIFENVVERAAAVVADSLRFPGY